MSVAPKHTRHSESGPRVRVAWASGKGSQMEVNLSDLLWGMVTDTGTLAPALAVDAARALAHHQPYLVGHDGWLVQVVILAYLGELAEVRAFEPRSPRRARGHVLARVPDLNPPASSVLDRFFSRRQHIVDFPDGAA